MAPALVEIDVLGPRRVRGAAAPFRRPASLELAVYLAFHRDGVSNAQWPLALWPERAVSSSTVHSTASDLRRALGVDGAGAPLLPRGTQLRLSDAVVSDVERFAAFASTGDPDALCRGLLLVRGPFLAGLRRTDWAILEGTQAAVEGMVTGAALRACRDLLARGLADRATWAVRRALLLSPYDERLFRALLETTAAQGNRLGLRATLAELLARAADAEGAQGPGPRASAQLSALHPQTAALYERLAALPPATGGRAARL